MDTSKEYIRMSSCPEVQKEWKVKNGDVFIGNFPHHIDEERREPTIYTIGDSWISETDEEEYQGKNEIMNIGCGCCACTINIIQWLPRQDQIQEMLEIATADDFRNVVDDMFYERDSMGLYDNLNDKWFVEELKTPEQLWLAFYMYEKHARIWSGKEWVPAT